MLLSSFFLFSISWGVVAHAYVHPLLGPCQAKNALAALTSTGHSAPPYLLPLSSAKLEGAVTTPDHFRTKSPMIAVLRIPPPQKIIGIADALTSAGFNMISITADTPRAGEAITYLKKWIQDSEHLRHVMVGGSTVVDAAQVKALAASGAAFISSPHFDPSIVSATKAHGLLSIPGVATPTEAFSALHAGADILKLFPAALVPPSVVKTLRTILPAGTCLLPAGGITVDMVEAYVKAGAGGFAIGSTMYQKHVDAPDLQERATEFVQEARRWSAKATAK